MSTSTEAGSTPRSSQDKRRNPLFDPLAAFDYQLRFLNDSYLTFYQERVKIEEAYIDSLLKLHKKTKAIDAYLDQDYGPSGMRQIWSEIRDSTEREAQSHSAFRDSMNTDVITPTLQLKEEQERIRKRIKEDIKESTNTYNEYAETVLPRLKRNYLRKCQEVEENKASQTSPPLVGGPDASTALSPIRSIPNSSPVVTNPQPLKPLSRRASGHHPQHRARSPSASNPLQDLAHQGKKQLNQFMTFLDNKGGTIKENVGGRSDATRSVRLKREADEADKEYRKGVHWLETLRLRRSKIVDGAFQSLELLVRDSVLKMKDVFEKYTADVMATSTTVSNLAAHAQGYITHMSVQRELAPINAMKPRFVKYSIPPRTLYTNYYVGDCNDLIFGVGLVDYAHARSLQDGQIPKLVKICIDEVDRRGLGAEGIYRVSARHAVVQEVALKVEKDERNFEFYPSDDIFVVAALLKQYLRTLPEPLFRYPLEDRIKHTEELKEHTQNKFLLLRGKVRRLPSVHQATLKAVVEHLARVAASSERNKMDPKNLAIVFGGVIFGEDEVSKATDLLTMQSWKDSLMEDMIINANLIFDDQALMSSPPKQPQAHISRTPSPPSPSSLPIPPKSPQTPAQKLKSDCSSPHTQDFTPDLPPRPSNSIHPSHRTANPSIRSADSDEEPAPPLPPRPLQIPSVSMDTLLVTGSEASMSSPTSENGNDSFATTDLTTPSVGASSPIASIKSPLVLTGELSIDSITENDDTPRLEHPEELATPTGTLSRS